MEKWKLEAFPELKKQHNKATFTKKEVLEILKDYDHGLRNTINDQLEYLMGGNNLLSRWVYKAIIEANLNDVQLGSGTRPVINAILWFNKLKEKNEQISD